MRVERIEEIGPNGKQRTRYEAPREHSTTSTPTSQALQRVAVTRCFSEIMREDLNWVWDKRFPLGKLSALAGDPGLGKTLLTIYMGSHITNGLAFTDGSPCEKGMVIYLSAEDDPGDTIRPRLEAAGADLSSAYMLEAVRVRQRNGLEHENAFSLETDVNVLDGELSRLKSVRLIVIDPISAYLGKVDSNNNAEVRGLLAPLTSLAAKYKVAVLGVTHLRKAPGPAVYRLAGSIAFVAAARAAWAVVADPSDPDRRLFLPIKQNLSRNIGGLAFRVEAPEGTPRIIWEDGPVNRDVNDFLDLGTGFRNGTKARRGREAEDWLRKVLANGPVLAAEIKAKAEKEGLAWATINRAKTRLGIVSGKEAAFEGQWSWSLLPEEGLDGTTEFEEEDTRPEDAQSADLDLSFFEEHAEKKEDNIGSSEDAQSDEMSTFEEGDL